MTYRVAPKRKQRKSSVPASPSMEYIQGISVKGVRQDFRTDGVLVQIHDEIPLHNPQTVVQWLEEYTDVEISAENQYGDLVVLISGWRRAKDIEADAFQDFVAHRTRQMAVAKVKQLEDARRLLREAGEL